MMPVTLPMAPRKRFESVEKVPLASMFGYSRAAPVRSCREGDNA